jgi:hypothetical protein
MRIVRLHPCSEPSTVALEFAYDSELIDVIRGLRCRRWDAGLRRWVIARSELERLRRNWTAVVCGWTRRPWS